MHARGIGAPARDVRKSIAVLPFEGLGDNNSPSYFADGVQDNILTDLGKVRDLKVISRSGVAPYRGKNRNMKQIGRDLGVANVLEGSVRFPAIACELTPSSSTPRRTVRFGQNNTIANWRTSSRSKVSWRKRSQPNSKQPSPPTKRLKFEPTHAGFASLRFLSSRPSRLSGWRSKYATRELGRSN